MNASEVVKKYREEHSMSLRQMAKIVGCNQTTLWRIETGECRPNMYTLNRIAKITGEDIDVLYSDTIQLGKRNEDEENVLNAYRKAPEIIQNAIKDILHIQ